LKNQENAISNDEPFRNNLQLAFVEEKKKQVTKDSSRIKQGAHEISNDDR
jgi:hypothetical protein